MRTQCDSKPLELEGHCSGRRHLVAQKLIVEISGVNVFVLKRRQGLDRLAGFLLGKAQLIELLQIEPEFRTGAEEVGQA